MPHPIQTSADVGRVAAALRGLLTELGSVPVRASRLAVAWDDLRGAFGDGPPPNGVSVDSNGRPDMLGLRVLISQSSALSDEARDALRDAIDAVDASGNCAWVFRDQLGSPDPTPEEIHRHQRDQLARGADDGPIRDAKKTIRIALDLMPAASQKSVQATPPPDNTDADRLNSEINKPGRTITPIGYRELDTIPEPSPSILETPTPDVWPSVVAPEDEGRKPDGFHGTSEFWFAGVKVDFGKANLPYKLVHALWDENRSRPRAARESFGVLNEVYDEDSETSDGTFRQLCSSTRRRFEEANCPLNIDYANGRIQLVPRTKPLKTSISRKKCAS